MDNEKMIDEIGNVFMLHLMIRSIIFENEY